MAATIREVSVCPRDRDPLVSTMEYPKAEWLCLRCGGHFGTFDVGRIPATDALLAAARQRTDQYRADYDRRHPGEGPARNVCPIVANPEPEDWSRWCIAWRDDHGYGVALLDGFRVDSDTLDAVKDAWHQTFPADRLRDRLPDPGSVQRAARRAYRIAADNPGGLPAWMLAGWAKHAATVARSARAELCRAQGGTGAELWWIENADIPFEQARRIVADVGPPARPLAAEAALAAALMQNTWALR